MEHSERPWLRWLQEADLVAPTGLILFLIATITGVTGIRTWHKFNDREPLLAGLPASGARQLSAPPARVLRRAVVIIADGLNENLSHELSSLRLIHQRGVRARGMAAGPTFSTPSYVTWLTGLDPVDSGVRTNRYRSFFPLDSLVRRANEAGLRTLTYEAGVHPLLPALFGPFIDESFEGETARKDALAAMTRAELVILAFDDCDRVGHRDGARAELYHQAARQLEQKIQTVLARLDLSQDLVVVVNDHGHLPGGGHGGKEEVVRHLFLVMAGPGIIHRPLAGAMDQKDLASMLALLLGLPPPAHNRGWPLEWALDQELGTQFHRARFLSQFNTRLRVERYLSGELLGGIKRHAERPRAGEISRAAMGNLDKARQIGRGHIKLLQVQVDRARWDFLQSLRTFRGTIWLAVLVFYALGLFASCKLRILRIGVMSLFTAVALMGTTTMLLHYLGVQTTLSYSGNITAIGLRVALAVGGPTLLQLGLIWILASYTNDGRDGLTGGVLASVCLLAVPAAGGHTLIVTAAGAALPDLEILAASLLVGVGFVIYLALAGLLLVLIGLVRRMRYQTPTQEFNS